MTKKHFCMIGTFAVCFMLTGCCISHEWKEATCTEPKVCTKCGKTEGDALGHTWVEATCAEPKHCSVCGETEGEALAHTWVEATCSEAKHCSVCGETEGEPLEHTLTEANYQQAATCEVCGATVGEPLQPEFEKYGLTCNTELDTNYPYVIPCYDEGYTTKGKVSFSDYEVFDSDETHEAAEGYEWKAVTLTILFDDENADLHGYGFTDWILTDYYSDLNVFYDYNENTDTYTIAYNGIKYTEAKYDNIVLQDKWINDDYILQYRLYFRVPKGYDGLVIAVCPFDSQAIRTEDGYTIYSNLADKDIIFFRLK